VLSWFVLQAGELFGLLMTAGLALFMIVSFKFLPPFFHDAFLKFLGITSCIYVIVDIKDDLIDRTNIGSDADALAELTGLPSVGIGIAWISIASISLILALRYVYKQQEIKM